VVRSAVRLISRLAILFALLWLARLWLKRWVDGPGVVPSSEAWPALEPPPGPAASVTLPESPAARRTAGDTQPTGETQPAGKAQAASGLEPQPATKPKPAATPKPAGRRASVADVAWVKPNGAGEAPVTHPVKAKLGSRVYRLPGMPSYEQSKPDRCYATPEAAEADGFTKAKR
jgi:hypothetical protein